MLWTRAVGLDQSGASRWPTAIEKSTAQPIVESRKAPDTEAACPGRDLDRLSTAELSLDRVQEGDRGFKGSHPLRNGFESGIGAMSNIYGGPIGDPATRGSTIRLASGTASEHVGIRFDSLAHEPASQGRDGARI